MRTYLHEVVLDHIADDPVPVPRSSRVRKRESTSCCHGHTCSSTIGVNAAAFEIVAFLLLAAYVRQAN